MESIESHLSTGSHMEEWQLFS